MVTLDNQHIFDCESNSISTDRGIKGKNKPKAEAFFQTLYDDLERR